MFSADTYRARRQRLQQQLGTGVVLLPGNDESPMNYPDNAYPFRQDSTFLYLTGLDVPGLTVVLDLDEGRTTLFGDDLTLEQVVWMGEHPTLAERAHRCGIAHTAPSDAVGETIRGAVEQGRTVHYLPPYRAATTLKLAGWLGRTPDAIGSGASVPLIDAVVAQRSVKDEAEVASMEEAVATAHEMHTGAMRCARPGTKEQEIAGFLEGTAVAHGGRLSFPAIVSRDGQTLHNHDYGNVLQPGDLVVCDSGAENALHYASDITRTWPIGGSFSTRQAEVYQVVLDAQMDAIAAVAPNAPFRDVHLRSARRLAQGLKDLGLMRGDVDEAVAAGAHALFFPHGLGHMMGLDVHDMEGLSEDRVGYDDEIQRSDQFGLNALRLGKRLEAGYVLTVEPGLYFIPALIDQWRADNTFAHFIDYERVDAYRNFGGIRIEDDVLVTPDGYRVLGPPIPKRIDEVEELLPEG